MQRLERTERMMIRWMCGVKPSDRKSNVELSSRLGMESVSDVVRRGRLRWFGHVECKESDGWMLTCRHVVVQSLKGRGCGRPVNWQVLTKTDKVETKGRFHHTQLDRSVM